MAIGVQTFRGERLKEARLARGLFKTSLADMLGISGMAISRYEDGQDKPLRGRLTLIAECLGFPEEFFLRSGWQENIEPVFWRSRATESKHAREMTEQRLRWACEIFNFLEEEVTFPEFSMPELNLPDDFRLITSETIELASEQIRHAWNLKNRPVPDVTLALENAGIPVINLDIPTDKQDGFCFYSEKLRRPIVGINTYNISCARARYDASHELGHCVLHSKVTPQQEKDPALKKLIEQQAHRFAGAFLFPRSAFLAEVGQPSLYYFCDLKKKWGMSIAAMVFRADDLGLIDKTEKALLYQSMGKKRWRGPLQEPFDDPSEMPLERPRMMRRGVEAVLQENIFGRSAIQSALCLPQRETEQLLGVGAGFFDSAQVVTFATPARETGLRTIDLESGNVLEFPLRQQGQTH
jgi:Zn-dependent peptidase ImmA (M78 family)/transcriptional regulator with XRE-family HTH domain